MSSIRAPLGVLYTVNQVLNVAFAAELPRSGPLSLDGHSRGEIYYDL